MSQRGNTKPARESQLALFVRGAIACDDRPAQEASVTRERSTSTARTVPVYFLPTGGEGRFGQASAPPMRAALPKGSAKR